MVPMEPQGEDTRWSSAGPDPPAHAIIARAVSDEFQRLDRLLGELSHVLAVPGEASGVEAEVSWQKLDLMYASMGPGALAALLRRQGMRDASVRGTLDVLGHRSRLRGP